MTNKCWKAKWIVDPEFLNVEPINVFHKEMQSVDIPAHKPELKNRHMFVRKEFDVPETWSKAILDISADDYYKLYINGRFVSQGPTPGYHSHYRYNRLDVTSMLVPGRNVIAVDVFYQGLINRVWNSGDYRQGMIAELFLDERLAASTDPSWKYFIPPNDYDAPTFGYDTQFSERIDNRQIPHEWRSLEFNDSAWAKAVENPKDDHQLFLQITPQLQVDTLQPETVKQIGNGEYLIDFGQEITGLFSARIQGHRGDKIVLRYSEELESEDAIKYPMRCNCAYEDSWILSGQENETIEFYDYKAFRYVQISGPSEAMKPNEFCAVVRHYPFDESRCEFNSSDELLDRIWKLCKNGVKYGSQEVYVDCPSREKGQYLGDVLISAHSQIYLTGDLRLLKKAIEDYSLSAAVCPGLMAVAPGSFMQEIADYSLQFPLLLNLYYQHSGDVEFLREKLPVAQNMLNWFKQYQRSDGLLENITPKWNLVDWPEEVRDNYDFDLPRPVGPGCHNVINAFYCGAVKTVEELSDVLEIPHSNEFITLRDAFVKIFYNSKTALFIDSEFSDHSSIHANILPLYFDFIPAQQKIPVVDFLKSKGMSCGVYMAYFLLHALARAGEQNYVYQLMTDTGPHSWANMLREGGTACFEAWGKEQKWNTSLCHPWSSTPISIIVEEVLGVSPGEPGWKSIRFTPHIPPELESAFLKLPLPIGMVKVETEKGCCRMIREFPAV